jgi:hypothetical protein
MNRELCTALFSRVRDHEKVISLASFYSNIALTTPLWRIWERSCDFSAIQVFSNYVIKA